MRIGIPGILGLIFVVLKLTHNISWPWLWVLAPFWGAVLLWIVIILLVIVFAISTGQQATFRRRPKGNRW